MADNLSEAPIWCDVGKNFSAAYSVVSFRHTARRKYTRDGDSIKEVKICPQRLEINSHEDTVDKVHAREDSVAVHFPDFFRVIPRSVSGLSTCGENEIQMRLGFEHQTSQESQEEFTKRILKEELSELRKGFHSVCCRMCGASILSAEIQFDRVLELPSENWLELAQDWCCHGTSHLISATGVLEPSEKDCFVGEYYIKVHPSIVKPGRLQISPGNEDQFIKCCRCKTTLGYVGVDSVVMDFSDVVSSIYLYKHAVSLPFSNLFRAYCIETFLSICLTSKSQGTTNFRFLIQEPKENGRRQAHACVWLFNADAAMITNIESETLYTCYSEGGLYSVSNKARYLRVLKILYKTKPLLGTLWEDEVASWRNNPTVQPLTFQKETCLHLILLLMKSTTTVAPSMREINGFKVGYLKTLNN
ncbi:E3 ubiquitin-protein ligase E3D-like [Stylophora pistillata]|uniref:E3 ubiquitin-protein ligase E3D-like n=1 Tax=Stylophora pistillata TaxID=50429 RepID=UPI000C04D4BF|nr:E3 ubiquitin-protein ligase E3D-like [Stylophora pistillata]